jgi:hypothetical protein
MSRRATLTLVLAVLAVGAGVGFWVLRMSSRRPEPVAAPRPSASAAPALPPGMLADPLDPERPVSIDTKERVVVGDWVNARPGFQYSRSPAERGGVEPCAPQRVDTSGFEDWAPLSQGRYSIPRGLRLDDAGHFNLVIHLHGDEPVRRELIHSGQAFVLYTLTLPTNQSYAQRFTGTHLFEAIVASVEQAVSKRAGKPAYAFHVALSAWSAGFVGIEAALSQPATKNIDAVVLIDGLHAPRSDRSAFKAQLQPFIDYAARAAAGERFLFISHSSINPPDFASTTECAHYLIASLGGKPQSVRRADAMGLELIELFSRGNLHVRGYAGNDKADHCAQLALLRDAFTALGRRWAAVPTAKP